MSKPSRAARGTRRPPRVAGTRKRASQSESTATTPADTEPAEAPETTESGSGSDATAGAAETDVVEAAPEPAAPEPAAPEPVAPEPVASEPVASEPAGPESVEPVGADAVQEQSAVGSADEQASPATATHGADEAAETGDGADSHDEAETRGGAADDGSLPPVDGTTGTAGGSGGGFVLPTVLASLAVVCIVLAVVFGIQAGQLRSDAGANQALVDAAATSEVKGQINEAVTKVFSYDFADTAKTEKAANELLVGQAVGKYNELFATIKEQAPKQKLVVTTTVKASAVKLLQDDRAEVLLFVDQDARRTDSGENNVGAAQILVGAEKHGDQWKISQITQR